MDWRIRNMQPQTVEKIKFGAYRQHMTIPQFIDAVLLENESLTGKLKLCGCHLCEAWKAHYLDLRKVNGE